MRVVRHRVQANAWMPPVRGVTNASLELDDTQSWGADRAIGTHAVDPVQNFLDSLHVGIKRNAGKRYRDKRSRETTDRADDCKTNDVERQRIGP
jgi:hypothetical protein